jgi:hypothetical protein
MNTVTQKGRHDFKEKKMEVATDLLRKESMSGSLEYFSENLCCDVGHSTNLPPP